MTGTGASAPAASHEVSTARMASQIPPLRHHFVVGFGPQRTEVHFKEEVPKLVTVGPADRMPGPGDPGWNDKQWDLQLTLPIAEVLTWRLASELVRRHPNLLWVDHSLPIPDANYDCLAIYRMDDPQRGAILLNRLGTSTNPVWLGDRPPPSEPPDLMR